MFQTIATKNVNLPKQEKCSHYTSLFLMNSMLHLIVELKTIIPNINKKVS